MYEEFFSCEIISNNKSGNRLKSQQKKDMK